MKPSVGLVFAVMFILASCTPQALLPASTPIAYAPSAFQHVPTATAMVVPKAWPNLHAGWTSYEAPAYISQLVIYDPRGYLWALAGDVVRWDLDTGQAVRYKAPSALGGQINDIALYDSRIWIAGGNGRVAYLTDDQWFAQEASDVGSDQFSTTPGKLWLSGHNALYYLDGKEWKKYDSIPEQYSSRDFDHIAIARSRDGSLWFQFEPSGLVVRFDGVQWQDYPSLLGAKSMISLSDRTLLFIFGNGVYAFDGKALSPVVFPGTRDVNIDASLLTPDGDLWLEAYATMLDAQTNGSAAYVPHTYIIHNGNAREIPEVTFNDRPVGVSHLPAAITPEGWVFRGDHQVYLSDGKDWREFGFADQSPISEIVGTTLIGFSLNGNLWVASSNLLLDFDGAQTRELPSNIPCASQGVYPSKWFARPDNTIWTFASAYSQAYLCRYDVETGDSAATKLFFSTSDIAFSPDGTLWAASDAGFITNLTQDYLSSGDYRDLKLIRIGEGLVDYLLKPSRIMTSRDGSIWVFVENAGLYRYDGNAWKYYGLSNLGDSSALAVAPDGKVWAGFAGGLLQYDGEKWVTYSHACINPSNLVVAPDGAVWFKNGCDGVYRFDGINWTHFEKDKQLGGIIPEQIMVAPDGALWFFSYNGWARYKP